MKNNKIPLDMIISLMPGHVYWKDVNGLYLGCNLNQAKSLNLEKPSDIIGKNDYDLLTKFENEEERINQARRIQENDSLVIKTKKEVRLFEEEDVNGEKIVYESRKLPICDKDNKIIGVLGISFDVTKEKELERQLVEKNNQLKILSGIIVHDLRTPISSLAVLNENLSPIINSLEKPRNIDAQESIYTIYETLTYIKNGFDQQIKAINNFIDKTLKYIKLKNFSNADNKILDLNEIVLKLIKLYPFSDNEKSLIHLDLKNNFEIIGDPIFIKNIINNLIENALYFINQNKKGEIKIWSSNDESMNYLNFRDTAGAMTHLISQKIFEPYITTKINGTGLGLAFAKQYMLSINGQINVLFEEGEFTQFILGFPKYINLEKQVQHNED